MRYLNFILAVSLLFPALSSGCKENCSSPSDTLQIEIRSSDQVFNEELSSLEITITIDQIARTKAFELGPSLNDGVTYIPVKLPDTLTADNTTNIGVVVYGFTESNLKGDRLAFASGDLRLSNCNQLTLELASSQPPVDAGQGTDAMLNQVDAEADAGFEDVQVDAGLEDAEVDAGFEDAKVPDSGIDNTSLLTVTLTGTGNGTIISVPAGIDCPGTCSYRFPLNTTVELQATPAPGNGFSKWNGECEGHNDCELLLDSDSEVETEFELGLVAYYALDGNANDNSRNGHNGTNMGADLASGIRGVPDTAYRFQNSEIIEVATSTSLSGFSEMTVCTWYALTSTTANADRFMVSHSNWGNNFRDDPYLMGVSRSSDAKAFTHFSYDAPSGPEYRRRELTISVVANVWKHFCFVYDGTDAILYLNGQLRQQARFPGQIMQEPNPLVLGNCNPSNTPNNWRCQSNNSLNGKLDDVKVYQRALSEVEITEEYNRR